MQDNQNSFRPRCLSIDLEVGVEDNRIHEFAVVRGDNGKSLDRCNQSLNAGLKKLDAFAEGLTFLLGHDIIASELPHLQAADTLRLNPLAFPRNPYHRLVKHYQDGQLHRGRLNDPELDARLTLEVFRDQRDAFIDLAREEPNLLLTRHWLTTSDEAFFGLNAFFPAIRRETRPTDESGIDAVERYLFDRRCITQVPVHPSGPITASSRHSPGGHPCRYVAKKCWRKCDNSNSYYNYR